MQAGWVGLEGSSSLLCEAYRITLLLPETQTREELDTLSLQNAFHPDASEHFLGEYFRKEISKKRREENQKHHCYSLTLVLEHAEKKGSVLSVNIPVPFPPK